MSDKNVTVVRDAIAAWQDDDEAFAASIRKYYDIDATWEPFSDFPEAAARRGHDEIIEGLMEVRTNAADTELNAKQLVAAEDKVVAEMVLRGTIRGTQDELEMEYGDLFTLRNGRITGVHSFHTFDEALKAARLSE